MNILIAASGTGGHLLPALSIAQAIADKDPTIKIHFVGSGRPLEEIIIGKAGFPLHTIPVVGIRNRGLNGFLQFLMSIPGAMKQVRILFNEVEPKLVIGVGGYVSVFPILWSRILGIPSLVHEAEIKPGWANWFLSFFVTKFSAAYKETTIFFQRKLFNAGHPIRQNLIKVRDITPLEHSPKNIFVTGGSQGAKYLDENVPKVLASLNNEDLKIVHQCRLNEVQSVTKTYEALSQPAEVQSFIEEIEKTYRWSDIIISRSGAGALREFEVINKPIIFIPLPYSLEQHENAMRLQKAGKAVIVEEGVDFEAKLKQAVIQLLDRSNYNKMKVIPHESSNIDASEKIAKVSLELLESGRNIP